MNTMTAAQLLLTCSSTWSWVAAHSKDSSFFMKLLLTEDDLNARQQFKKAISPTKIALTFDKYI